ncbi:MAG: ATP synthase subunit I [Trueperaceae bacterium]|nr:ATP synthase subunit I [Trueperaceae bacterium]
MTAVLGAMDAATLVGAFALGLALGAGYFGGLWWTLARMDRWRRPAVALAVSFALRAGLALAVFAALARLGLAPLGAAFLGFVAVRLVASWRLARDRSPGGTP